MKERDQKMEAEMNFEFAREAQIAIRCVGRYKKFLVDVLGKKVYIGHEKRYGWTGELPFYLFKCGACGHYAKDYPHGWPESQYLICSHCDIRHDFVGFIKSCKMAFETIRIIWQIRKNRI